MCVKRSIDPIKFLSQGVVAMVFYLLWGDIIVVVTPLPVVTEAVSVLHTEVKVLGKGERELIKC